MLRFILFSERLSAAIAKYHNRVITLLQIITEMIEMGKYLRNEPKGSLSNEDRETESCNDF